jgi:glycosyltransferase involved in cell wall biosynthesis
MRIAQLVDSLEIGGAERMVVDLTLGLQKQAHSVSVVCLRQRGPLAKLLEESSIDVLALQKGRGPSLQTIGRLAAYLKRERVDVVHTHNPLTHHYGVLAGRQAEVSAIVNTFHGPSNLTGFGTTMVIFEASCLLSDQVVACCEAVGQHLRKITYIAKRRLTVIPNGISLEHFIGIPARKSDGTFVFGMVGRLVPVKDHATLLKAFARVRHEERASRLELLGDGPLYSTLRKEAQALGLADHVIFHRSSLDVPNFLSRLDTFVLSSLSEGLPLSILEAMAAGLPIVGTSVGAVPELIETSKCGWTCPSAQPTALANAMLASLHSTQRLEHGSSGRKHVIQFNSIEAMTVSYERLFQQLVNSRSDRRSSHHNLAFRTNSEPQEKQDRRTR